MEHIIRYLGACYGYSAFRGKEGPRILESRIRQAASVNEPTLFVERVAELMQCDPIHSEVTVPAMSLTTAQLGWIRRHHKVTAALALSAFREPDKLAESVAAIGPIEDQQIGDQAMASPVYEIPMRVTMRTPLAHGGDESAGNATLFRRKTVMGRNGGLLSIPYYAGNAWRGLMRDLLADDFTTLMGFEPSKQTPPWQPWFFHCLYAGGSLGDVDKVTSKKLGERPNATVVLQERHKFRDYVPMLSVLGVAIGNTLMAGKIDTGDLEPECYETGVGNVRASELMTWEFLTRRDDQDYEREKHEGMIATHEVMVAGAVLRGGLDLRPNIRPHELGLVGRGLNLLRTSGKLGGSNRRGWGQIEIECEAPDEAPYLSYIEAKREEILSYLRELKAVADAGG
jgi:hypothetical protein